MDQRACPCPPAAPRGLRNRSAPPASTVVHAPILRAQRHRHGRLHAPNRRLPPRIPRASPCAPAAAPRTLFPAPLSPQVHPMGHLHDSKAVFSRLQQRIDKTQSGLPPSPEVFEILKELFTVEEAEIASRLPVIPRKLSSIARRLGVPAEQLRPKLERMADKGLVFDFVHPTRGPYFMLAPPVVGFFEFTMMRVRSDIDQKTVARLLALYMYERPEFMREVLRGGTPIGRTLVHEDAVSPELSTDILDFERASALIDSAPLAAVSLCYCRHKKSHLGEACDAPQEICISLGHAAAFVLRRGHGRKAERPELIDLLHVARDHHLVQIADNVKHEPAYLCNCCGCCCGQLAAINRHGIDHAVATSNFIATIREPSCNGCAKCVRLCPIQAISLHHRPPHQSARSKKKFVARVDPSICLGCGVCKVACTHDALHLEPRPQRVLTPETTTERILRMAIGRGHLHDVLFDDQDGPTAAFLNRLVGALERMPTTQRVVLNETLKSRFVRFLAGAAPAPPTGSPKPT